MSRIPTHQGLVSLFLICLIFSFITASALAATASTAKINSPAAAPTTGSVSISRINQHKDAFVKRKLEASSSQSTLPLTRISGGTAASEGEFPHAVAFVAKTQRLQYCSGSLLNSTFVITAAHCLFTGKELDNPRLFGVVAGYNTISQSEIVYRPIIDVRNYWVHPNYIPDDTSQNSFDIAIVELAEPVNGLTPAVLLDSQADYAPYEETGTSLQVIGWGSTPSADASDVLLKTTISLYSQSNCRSFLSGAGYNINYMICGAGSGTKDACAGDSGSGLIAKRGSEYIIVGLTSFGAGECGGNSIGGYTRVSAFLDYVAAVRRGEYAPSRSPAGRATFAMLAVAFATIFSLLAL